MKRLTTTVPAVLIAALAFPFWGNQIDTKRVFQRVGKPFTSDSLKGQLRRYTEWGSYPIAYYTKAGDHMCGKCASEQAHNRRDWPKIIDAEMVEGDPVNCSHCYEDIT